MSNAAAIADVKKLAKSLRGILELADALEKVETVEKHNEEMRKAHVVLAEQTKKLQELYNEQEKASKAAIDEANAAVESSRKKAVDIVSKAKDEAERLSVAVAARGKSILDAAKLEAEQAKKEVEASLFQVSELNEEISEKLGELQSIKEEIAVLKKKFGG